MAFDLQAGFGAGAGADMLQQILRQKAQEAFQNQSLALAQQRQQQEAELQKAQLASIQADRQAKEQQMADVRSMEGASMLEPGVSTVQPSDAITKIIQGGIAAPTLRPDQTLGSTNLSGTVGGPLSTTANPGQATGALRFMGTPAQLKEQAAQAAVTRLSAANPQLGDALAAIPDADKRAGILGEYVKGITQPGDTSGQQTARYLAILQKAQLGQPLAPEESAFRMAYERNKMMGPEAAAAAAANRQASTQAAAIAQQARAQDFTEQQAGRAELTNKVEQPYLDAREKADTLRNVVDAAKAGNTEAAAIQPLLATLGVTTMEGVKRINSTEIAQVAGAGSLLQQVKSKASKLLAGQPLTPDLQNDLINLAGVLEKGATEKYLANFDRVKTRYGLKTEQPLASALQTPTGSSGFKVEKIQ